MIVEHKKTGAKFFATDRLYRALSRSHVSELKKRDNNKIFIVCGETGIGKSVFTNQCCAIVDPNFDLKNIQFTTDEMIDYLSLLKNSAISFDESFRGASSRNTMNKSQKKILEMLYEVRQLNQVIFFVAPSFFRLDEAIALELSDGLFYVYKQKGGRRGWKFFNRKQKEQLYRIGTKKGSKNYNAVYTKFKGNFPNNYVVDEAEYRKKKFDSLHKPKESDKKKDPKDKIIEDKRDREARLWKSLLSTAGTFEKAREIAKQNGIEISSPGIHQKIQKIT